MKPKVQGLIRIEWVAGIAKYNFHSTGGRRDGNTKP